MLMNSTYKECEGKETLLENGDVLQEMTIRHNWGPTIKSQKIIKKIEYERSIKLAKIREYYESIK